MLENKAMGPRVVCMDSGGKRNGKRHKEASQKDPKAQVQEAQGENASPKKKARALIWAHGGPEKGRAWFEGALPVGCP